MVTFGSFELTDDCPFGVRSVAACGDHSLFVKSDGSLWGFGYNSHGELGMGDKTNRLTPTQILALRGEASDKRSVSFLYLSNRMARSGEWGITEMVNLGNNLKSYYLEPIQINVER